MDNRQIRAAILLTILAIMIVLGIYVYMQYDKLKNAKWKYAGTKINSLGLQTNVFTLYLSVDNPGDLSVTISGQDYTVYLNELQVAKIQNKTDIPIAPNGVSIVPLQIVIETKDLINAGVQN